MAQTSAFRSGLSRLPFVLTIRIEPRRQAVAFAAGAALTLSRLVLGASLGSEAPFLTSWLGILTAAYIGGLFPALAVSLVGFLAGQHWAAATHGDILPAGWYFTIALALALVGEINRGVLRRRTEDAQNLAEIRTRLARVARLNAMGEIAGTLAHELNQPLSAIGSYSDAARWMLADRKGSHADVLATLEKIERQVERAGEIIARVRGYVAGERVDLLPSSLEHIVREAVEVSLTSAVKEGLSVRFDLDPACDRVLADRIGIQQVVVNLLRNAAEASADSPKRAVLISSRRCDDGMIRCSVADSGRGFAPEARDRLFEPFASGKPGGMGIGLAVSRGIIEAQGGRIWAEPGVTGGAVFSFSLLPAQARS